MRGETFESENSRLLVDTQLRALHGQVDELAADIGRLRRNPRIAESSLEHLCARIADRVETIDCILQPSAAELAAMFSPGCDITIDAAIAAVDRRARAFRHTLGGQP